jgi:hypothetical protein
MPDKIEAAGFMRACAHQLRDLGKLSIFLEPKLSAMARDLDDWANRMESAGQAQAGDS